MSADTAPREPTEAREALRALFAGRAEVLAKVEATLERIGGTRLPVLVEGEAGTGRTLLARVIHATGPQRRSPRVEVEATTLSPDALARALGEAQDGTLVLEGVDGLPASTQVALLDAIRAGATRIVATTSEELDRAVSGGWLLADLRDRLSVLRLRLPPLREQPDAAPLLVGNALRALAPGAELDPAAALALRALPWPGNAVEVGRAARALGAWAEGGPVLRAHVARWAASRATAERAPAEREPAAREERPPARRDPSGERPALAAGAAAERTLEEVERALLFERLERHDWRQAETARSLGIDRKTLYRKIRAFGLVRRA